MDIAGILDAGGTEVVNDDKDHSHCDHEHDHCEHTGDGHAHHHHKHEHSHDHYLSLTLRPHGKADKARFNDFLNEGCPACCA